MMQVQQLAMIEISVSRASLEAASLPKYDIYITDIHRHCPIIQMEKALSITLNKSQTGAWKLTVQAGQFRDRMQEASKGILYHFVSCVKQCETVGARQSEILWDSFTCLLLHTSLYYAGCISLILSFDCF